jgi:hypothetical protein
VFALLSCAHARRPRERFPELFDDDLSAEPPHACHLSTTPRGHERGCAFESRAVSAFGPTPRDPLPDSTSCPMHVRVSGDHVIAEPMFLEGTFDSLPFMRCPDFVPIARRVLPVDGGYLVSEVGITQGELLFIDERGRDERRIARGRFGGFARTSSGSVLAVASGRAHLGRGAVLRLDQRSTGDWRATFLAVLPLEPAIVSLEDEGSIVAYADRFVFRVDDTGKLENLHYLSRDVGRVASIARTTNGTIYLGVECGVIRIADGNETWWSARDGASGRWRSCRDSR